MWSHRLGYGMFMDRMWLFVRRKKQKNALPDVHLDVPHLWHGVRSFSSLQKNAGQACPRARLRLHRLYFPHRIQHRLLLEKTRLLPVGL